MNNMHYSDVGWVAGVFEGEGTFGISEKQVYTALHMVDEDTINRLHRLTGIGVVYDQPVREGKKQSYMWKVGTRKDVEDLIWTMLPFLGERRSKRAHEALAKLEELNAAAEYRKNFFKCGHPVTTENTRFDRGGNERNLQDKIRRCVTCYKARFQGVTV